MMGAYGLLHAVAGISEGRRIDHEDNQDKGDV